MGYVDYRVLWQWNNYHYQKCAMTTSKFQFDSVYTSHRAIWYDLSRVYFNQTLYSIRSHYPNTCCSESIIHFPLSSDTTAIFVFVTSFLVDHSFFKTFRNRHIYGQLKSYFWNSALTGGLLFFPSNGHGIMYKQTIVYISPNYKRRAIDLLSFELNYFL